jgi:hypothetical protein
MLNLQTRPTLSNPRPGTRKEVLGERFESARRLFIFAPFVRSSSIDPFVLTSTSGSQSYGVQAALGYFSWGFILMSSCFILACGRG